MLIEQRNALLPKFDATRAARDRIRSTADMAARNLHEIGIACAEDDDAFARQQNSADQSLARAIVRVASVKAVIAEIEAALPALKAQWEA